MRVRIFTIALALMLALTGTVAAAADAQGALIPNPLPAKDVAVNPYMASGDGSIHNDPYATDVTDAVAPLGIYSRVGTSLETQNPQAPSAAFYDAQGNAITPFNGGISIVDMEGERIERLGSFVPARDDGGGYAFQISYSFVDSHDRVIAPTSHGHILVMRTMDEHGDILPTFEKCMDIDVMSAAKGQLGTEFSQNLLSIVYDYEGNLWFTTGGFRIYPDRGQTGFIGYISSEYMRQLDTGEQVPLEGNIHIYPLTPGEGAENGIASNPDGVVILTNLACYMLTAQDGVSVSWRTEYGSNGTNDAQDGSDYTGGGLAWGSGTSPTLTDELVIFTDNLDPINLIALSSKTGEVVAQTPVLDALGEDVPVSVENSILVYAPGDGSATVIVCNWFGAGNAALANPDADSSIQTYANIYDANWMSMGNAYIAPGVERVDFVPQADGSYEARKVWLRDDICETAMIKLSTATGYLYGYWQDLDTGMWRYEVLDFDTGDTLLTADAGTAPGYNNVAVGLIIDPNGNALYCPTNCMEMVRWQDEIAYLPDCPAKQIPLGDMARSRPDAAYADAGLEFASYINTVTVGNLRAQTALAVRVNGLSAAPEQYALYYVDESGALVEWTGEWAIVADGGAALSAGQALDPASVYEIRLDAFDGMEMDLNPVEYELEVSIVLVEGDA